jgi:ABC-type sulfate/molybdate transport systems ATPase subunit
VVGELDELLSELRLPTLLVTHTFEDAAVLGRRIGVLDHGQLVQLATPTELVRRPANALVAALTGANILDGTATPAGRGSIINIAGGGELTSAARAEGPVKVAVHPWELELADPASSTLVDTVMAIREDRGGVAIRLTRLTVRAKPGANGVIAEGQAVGLRAAPSAVRVFS